MFNNCSIVFSPLNSYIVLVDLTTNVEGWYISKMRIFEKPYSSCRSSKLLQNWKHFSLSLSVKLSNSLSLHVDFFWLSATDSRINLTWVASTACFPALFPLIKQPVVLIFYIPLMDWLPIRGLLMIMSPKTTLDINSRSSFFKLKHTKIFLY